jgi:thiol-disulfide isomerase/thioredoxin
MRQKPRRWLLAGLGICLIVGVWVVREPLRRRVGESATLANPAPPPEIVEGVIEASPDRAAAISAAWNTGRIVHREVAMREIARLMPADRPLPAELEEIVLTGALDVDANVRESALGILRERKDPALASLAVAQIQDHDPQVRLFGLNQLRQAGAAIGVPVIIPLLDDDDPLIVATGLKLLESWSGEKFGVKISETVPAENAKTGLKEYSEASRGKARAGVARAKSWWAEHQAEFPPVQPKIPDAAITARKPVPAADFSLTAVDGRKVRLADFRGKVVLINFWTTWCTACVGEMPELVALQKQHGDGLVILGVSLDFVPDEHGHLGGVEAVEEQGLHKDEDADATKNQETLKNIRAKVLRTVKARGINYTVLLDEKNEIGGRFNGGELPTTVIVDAEGNVRRRFIGARSLPVFEAMIAEAGQPVKASGKN